MCQKNLGFGKESPWLRRERLQGGRRESKKPDDGGSTDADARQERARSVFRASGGSRRIPRARLESDAAMRRRSTDANHVRPDATFGLPRSRRPTRVQGKREVRCARSGAFGDARARSSAPKRGGTWDSDASKRLCRRTSPRRRVGVGVSAARVVRLCTVTRHPRFFSVHLRLSCAVAGDRCRVDRRQVASHAQEKN